MPRIPHPATILALVVASALLAPGQALKERDLLDTIRITTRLVQVDMVVTDKQGRPVRGLQREDFTLFEEGKPQEISLFAEETRSRGTTDPQAGPPLDFVSNQPPDPGSAVSIVLLDLLNTSFTDRPFALKAFTRFVEHSLRPGETVAVFALGSELTLLQGFTKDHTLLKQAVQLRQSYAPEPQEDRSASEQIQAVIDSDPAGEMRETLGTVLAAMQQTEEAIAEERLRNRVHVTLEALKAIARASQGYGRRKALVWISGAFPLTLSNSYGVSVFDQQVKRALAVLADAHIAVYPADVRGLVATAAPPVRSTAAIARAPEMVAAQAAALEAPIDTMKRVAELTGGLAFYRRNDVDRAVAAAIEDGLSYYTLAYYPRTESWNGLPRQLTVKVKRSGMRVRHRSAYFASALPKAADQDKDESGEREFRHALTLSPLPASQLHLHARLVPPSATVQHYSAEFFIVGNTIEFAGAGEKHVAGFDVRAVAAIGKKYYQVGGELVRVSLPQERYEKARQTGLLHSIRVTLQPGQYRLRLGVRDSVSGKIGAVDLPVNVPATSSSAAPAAGQEKLSAK